MRAARVAAQLGDRGRPLVPALEALLTDPLHTPAAVLALHAIAPGTLDVRTAAGLLLDSAEEDADAATALEALRALGPDALTEDHGRRLAALAERDLRVTASGVETAIAATDDRLREQAREVLRVLSAGPAAAGPERPGCVVCGPGQAGTGRVGRAGGPEVCTAAPPCPP